jgi:hypothetical protein
LAAGAWLDPWSLGEHRAEVLVGSSRMAARHAQAVVIGMGFLQLLLVRILAAGTFLPRVRLAASSLSGVGALAYAAGYALYPWWPDGAWLSAAGALLNFLAFALLLPAAGCPLSVRMVLAILSLGMLVDAVMVLFAVAPGLFLPAYLGGEDGVRLRMLRLGRAAVIALSLLALLYQGLPRRAGPCHPVFSWAGIALWVGAVGMPLTLATAAFTTVEVKYLLPIPAQATFLGVLAAVWLARRRARPLELWGWSLVAVSMAAGRFMGLYAFDGPLPAPGWIGAYNEFPRRLVRLGHAYPIVLGLIAVLLAREQDQGWHTGRPARVGVPLLTTGSVLLEVVLLLAATLDVGGPVLSVGPALVTAGLVLCLVPQKERRDGQALSGACF